MVLLKKCRPKLWFLPQDEKEEEDAGAIAVLTDRIPSVLIVRWFDMFCFGFAMCSYVLDFFSDIGISILHFSAGRYLSGALILTFALVPSIIINIISMIWMLDDEMHWKRRAHPRRTGTIELDRKRFISVAKMTLLCGFQMGPLFWYYKALYYGNLFRSGEKDDKLKRRHFMKMVEAERDATWLRFYEAFLESAPQMIIQGSIASRVFLEHFNDTFPFWLYFQSISLFLSMISISWSVVVQNRSLRMIRDDKVNIWPHEAVLQFFWRFLTILARMITLSAAVLVFGIYVIPLIIGHLILTMIHLVFLQALHIENCTNVEKMLFAVNTFIHIFTPFNMAEGNTRYRYLAAYTLEFFEMMAIFLILPNYISIDFPYIEQLRLGVPVTFFLGITIAIIYYNFFHPNRRQSVPTPSQFDLNLDLENAQVFPKSSKESSVGARIEDVADTLLEVERESESESECHN
uniref:Cell death abnormality protein 8 n=2 Tax=Caenorhabditis japonica TaxID=281687 RepID=A0A8R1DV98_CAEJA